MKKRIAAIVLSMAVCVTTVGANLTAAADFTSEGTVAETTADLTEFFSTETVEGETADTSDFVSEGDASGQITIDGSTLVEEPDSETADEPQPSEEPEASDIEITEPEISVEDEEDTFAEFTSENEQMPVVIDDFQDEETDAALTETENPYEKSIDNGKEASLVYTRWELDSTQKKWRLSKLPEKKAVVQSTEEAIDEGFLIDAEAADDAGEEATESEPETVSESEETAAAVQADTASEENAYYTSEDGLVKICTIDANGTVLTEGYYAFDKDGWLLTGRTQVGTNADYYYFKTASEAKTSNELTPEYKAPYNSDLGQMCTNLWMWDAKAGRFYYYCTTADQDNGKQKDPAVNKIYCINGEYYFLREDCKPYVGDKNTTYNGRSGLYTFRKASSASDIPGKMVRNTWYSANGTQWRFFGSDGRYVKKGIGAYKLLSNSSNLYLLNANGYLIKGKMTKAANGYYYLSNNSGVVYREKLVKYGKYRYYFVSDGRRATWKNRWVQCKGAGNRYYYFGKTAGRVQEQKGIKKVTVNGKFVGWFYFSSAGNSFLNAWKDGRYYLSDGRMASGLTKIGNKYYFFKRSSSKSYKGKVYKSTWVKYNGKYYYASKNGVLAENGWKRIKTDGKYYYFYFKNCTAVTNKTGIKRGNQTGILDGRGRFISGGWFVYNNSKNYARYIDPKTGKIVKNKVKTINGVQYRFDKYGNRVNDRTKEFKRSSYYLTCDRVNGVMTVYTDSSKKIPIKTIRVSVGKAETPTLTGTFTLTRSLRWQPLMGPSWGQYGTHVVNGIFIHSVASSERNDHNLPKSEYLKLGSPASHGCIRCCVADAKWVYENCNGSTIYVFDGTYKADEALKGPLGRNPLTPLRGNKTFDPTDPAYN